MEMYISCACVIMGYPFNGSKFTRYNDALGK